MRAILVGSERERDLVRWQLEGTGVTVVGEFATVADARRAGIETDTFIMAATAAPDIRRRAEVRTEANAIAAEPLTAREIAVLELLAEGLSNKAIATCLGISDQTVKFHVASITGKLGAANRTEAVRRALRRGLLTV